MLGNVLLLIATLIKKREVKNAFYIAGLISFWVTIFYLSQGDKVAFNFVFRLPSALMTVFPFVRKYLHRFTKGWMSN